MDNGDQMALKTIVSDFSFSGIPMCEETHMKHLGLFISNISLTSLFLG